jgi:hypothetical protein
MFSPRSRYYNQSTYPVTSPSTAIQRRWSTEGTTVTVVSLPLPRHPRVRGFHRRTEGQRLDLVANYYLGDPAGFWRLCDASGAMAPDALAVHDLVAVPFKRG